MRKERNNHDRHTPLDPEAAALVLIIFGISLLYDSHEDFSWTQRSLAEVGPNGASVFARIADESVDKPGRAEMH